MRYQQQLSVGEKRLNLLSFAAQVIAESYFRQVGITTYFVKFDTQGNVQVENAFDIPAQGNYNTSYPLEIYKEFRPPRLTEAKFINKR